MLVASTARKLMRSSPAMLCCKVQRHAAKARCSINCGPFTQQEFQSISKAIVSSKVAGRECIVISVAA
eukprot:21237-Heterococcus_DN1.PRE.1